MQTLNCINIRLVKLRTGDYVDFTHHISGAKAMVNHHRMMQVKSSEGHDENGLHDYLVLEDHIWRNGWKL